MNDRYIGVLFIIGGIIFVVFRRRLAHAAKQWYEEGVISQGPSRETVEVLYFISGLVFIIVGLAILLNH